MNLLILSLLIAGVSSHIIFPATFRGVVQSDDSANTNTTDCPFRCPRGMKCRNGRCPIIHNRHQFNLPCVAPCAPGQKCVNGVCVGIDMLHSKSYEFHPIESRSGPIECHSHADCKSRELCENGFCVERFAAVSGYNFLKEDEDRHGYFADTEIDPANCTPRCKIPLEVCHRGMCKKFPRLQFSFVLKKCSTDFECGEHMLCVDGKCIVNNGLGGLCSADSQCPKGFICVDGKCKKSSRRFHSECPAECPFGTTCVSGDCAPIHYGLSHPTDMLSDNTHQGSSHRQFNLQCTSTCHPGQRCVNGECQIYDMFSDNTPSSHRQFNLPCTAPCAPGQKCVNGGCVGIDMLHSKAYEFHPTQSRSGPIECHSHADCNTRELCENGFCVERFAALSRNNFLKEDEDRHGYFADTDIDPEKCTPRCKIPSEVCHRGMCKKFPRRLFGGY